MPSVDFGLYYYVVKGIGFCELHCYWTARVYQSSHQNGLLEIENESD